MELTLKEVCDALERIDTPTNLTCNFDALYGQKKNRWWDAAPKKDSEHSTQQYHLLGYYLCRGHHNGSINPKCKIPPCYECYQNRRCNPDGNSFSDTTPDSLFWKMQRPEMYLWLLEALGLLTDTQLKELCDTWLSSGKNSHLTRMALFKQELQNRYHISWKEIEKKLL